LECIYSPFGISIQKQNEREVASDIPIVTMVKGLLLQSICNTSDEITEREIHDCISFMNFLGYPEWLPDASPIWLLREKLSTTGRDRAI